MLPQNFHLKPECLIPLKPIPFMKTTKPLELVYFSVFPTPTKDEGTVYTFIALDDYSEFLFLIGTETDLNERSIVDNIIRFTQNKDFAGRYDNKPFTLMLPFEKDSIPHDLVTDILKLLHGSVIYDQETVSKKIQPVLNAVFGN
jgi:hypothetical protein